MTALAASTDTRDRAIEFGAAAVLHVVLLVGLSAVLLTPKAPPPPPAPMDVTIADDVGLQATAPQRVTPPAQSSAPELGAPEDAAPPAPSAEPEPTPARPQPAEAPPAPKRPEIAKPQPVQKLAPTPPRPAKPQPVRQATPAPPQPARPRERPAPSGALAGIVGRGSGATPGAKAARPTGSSLGKVISGLGADPTPSRSKTPQGATMSQAAAMDIGSKIKQQVEPCAHNQTSPGPGAGRIAVSLRLRFNADGSLAARPTVEGHTGVDDGNSRYVRQVDDRAISAFMACQPLRGLPAQYYDVPNGWANFVLRYRFSGWGS